MTCLSLTVLKLLTIVLLHNYRVVWVPLQKYWAHIVYEKVIKDMVCPRNSFDWDTITMLRVPSFDRLHMSSHKLYIPKLGQATKMTKKSVVCYV